MSKGQRSLTLLVGGLGPLWAPNSADPLAYFGWGDPKEPSWTGHRLALVPAPSTQRILTHQISSRQVSTSQWSALPFSSCLSLGKLLELSEPSAKWELGTQRCWCSSRSHLTFSKFSTPHFSEILFAQLLKGGALPTSINIPETQVYSNNEYTTLYFSP